MLDSCFESLSEIAGCGVSFEKSLVLWVSFGVSCPCTTHWVTVGGGISKEVETRGDIVVAMVELVVDGDGRR